jgi:hypothetical protein
MKKLTFLLAGLILISGSAIAGDIVIPVNLGSVGFADITGQCLSSAGSGFGGLVSGVDLCYDPLGSGQTGLVFPGNIFGGTAGVLHMLFFPPVAFPVTSLHFDFLYTPATNIGDSLTTVFQNAGTFADFATAFTTAEAFGNATGVFNYAGVPFTTADLTFATAASNFEISNLSYDISTPEPGSMALLGFGLVGMAAFYRRRR